MALVTVTPFVPGSRPAALDPGSAHCGLAAGDASSIIAHQVNVIDGDALAAATAIVAWLVSVGATSLVIEWAPAWMSGDKGADMARAKTRDAQHPIISNVARLCRERGIDAATDKTIAASRGPGLIGVSTWRSTIGALSVKDHVTGRHSTKDAAVRAALIRLLGADAVRALGPGDHRRDAAGLLLGSLLAPPAAERGPRGDKRRRTGVRGARSREGYTPTPEQKERHRVNALASYHRTAAKRPPKPPRGLDAGKLAAALAGGPLRQGALAAALGYLPASLPAALARYVATGGHGGVEVGRVRMPGEGWDRYALAPEKRSGPSSTPP